MAAEIVGRLLAAQTLLQNARAGIRRTLYARTQASYRELLLRYWRFPLVVLPSSVLNALESLIPIPIVASLYGAAAAGKFLLAQRLAALVEGFVTSSVNDVVHSRVAELHASDPGRIRSILVDMVRKLGVVSLAIYLPLAIAAPLLVRPVLGRRWQETGLLVAVLTPASFVDLIVVPLSRAFIVVNRQGLKLAIDALQLVGPATLFLWHRHGWSLVRATAAYGFISAITAVAYLVLIVELYRESNAAAAAVGAPGSSLS
jgi:O-antigen/teichoic acid export membrane protein